MKDDVSVRCYPKADCRLLAMMGPIKGRARTQSRALHDLSMDGDGIQTTEMLADQKRLRVVPPIRKVGHDMVFYPAGMVIFDAVTPGLLS